jgi:transposase
MKAKRRRHDSDFKAKVALEAIRGVKTVQEIAKEFDLHPVQISDWKKQLLERSSSVFEGAKKQASDEDFERERVMFNSKIGELTMQLDFVTKKSKQLGLSASSSWSNPSTRS